MSGRENSLYRVEESSTIDERIIDSPFYRDYE
jgi:hypothetical protein